MLKICLLHRYIFHSKFSNAHNSFIPSVLCLSHHCLAYYYPTTAIYTCTVFIFLCNKQLFLVLTSIDTCLLFLRVVRKHNTQASCSQQLVGSGELMHRAAFMHHMYSKGLTRPCFYNRHASLQIEQSVYDTNLFSPSSAILTVQRKWQRCLVHR